jgi:probable rRNA maturation factor
VGNGDVKLDLDLQVACEAPGLPDAQRLRAWAAAALAGRCAVAELTIRVVDEAEGTQLNQRYRGQPGPTNVLSFPFDPPPGLPPQDFIGDLVICAPLVAREAQEQGKPEDAHWAHLVVHGTLHLLGYDHLTDPDATEMEAMETVILAGLGFPSPYEAPERPHDQ